MADDVDGRWPARGGVTILHRGDPAERVVVREEGVVKAVQDPFGVGSGTFQSAGILEKSKNGASSSAATASSIWS
jgi:hypothetical protein